jgi:membrane-associated phospholipid phosphatase
MINLIDKLILLYELLLTVHVLLFKNNVSDWVGHLQLNFVITSWVFLSAWAAYRIKCQPFKFVHTFYPIFLLIWQYPQACALQYSIIPFSLDSMLIKWDLAIFQIPLYEVIPKKLNIFTLEIFHFFYFSYYLSLAVPVWIVYKKRHPLINEYLFVIMLTTALHQWFLIFLPADGPIPLRDGLIPEGVFMIPIMNLIYKLHPGGGAMPSLHVAGGFITCMYAYKFLPYLRWLWILLFAGITTATFVCSYHYPIDSLVGIFTGWLCYIYIPRIYDYLYT